MNKTKHEYFHKHVSILVGDNLSSDVYIWGGDRPGLPCGVHDSFEKKQLLSSTDVFNARDLTFMKRPTTGTPPNGAIGYSSCCIGDDIYYFGGRCDDSCYHNDLSMLNTRSNKWNQIVCNNGPMKKEGCGMIPFSINGDNYISVIGGWGPLSPYPSSHAQYNSDPNEPSRYFTNEVHVMCVSITPGEWSVPKRTGSVFPPSRGFSINTLSGNRAIIFGGERINEFKTTTCDTNDVFIVSYTNDTVDFQRLDHSATNVPRPEGRCDHSSVVISSVSGNGEEKHYLLVLGGHYFIRSDCFVKEITGNNQWKQIFVPEVVTNRWCHSISCYNTSDHRRKWLIVFGGQGKTFVGQTTPIHYPNRLMIVELVFSPTDDNWTVAKVLNEEDMKSNKPIFDSLSKQMVSELSIAKTRLENERRAHDITREQMDDKDRQLREKNVIIQQKDEVIQQKDNAMQQKDGQLHEKDQLLQQKDAAIQQKQAEITFLQNQLENRPWQQMAVELKDRELQEIDIIMEEHSEPELDVNPNLVQVQLMHEEIQGYKDQLEAEKNKSQGMAMEIEKLRRESSNTVGVDDDPHNYISEAYECLDNVHVGKEVVFHMQGDQPESFHWSEWGLRIHIPENSPAPAVGVVSSDPASTPPLCSEIAVKALVGGKFQFPQGSELVSAVYAISFANELRKPVQLEIQHCAMLKSESQFKQLTFVKAPMRQCVPPFEFSPLEGGEFSIDSQWGSITLDHFCLVAILVTVGMGVGALGGMLYWNELRNPHNQVGPAVIAPINPEVHDDDDDDGDDDDDEVDLKYSAQLVYSRYGNRMNQWSVWFMAMKDINALQTYLREKHPTAELSQLIPFKFDGNNGVLKLNIAKKVSCNGWTLTLDVHPLKIRQKQINKFGRNGGVPEPSSCVIRATVSDPKTAENLYHGVPIEGVVCDAEQIFINRYLERPSFLSPSLLKGIGFGSFIVILIAMLAWIMMALYTVNLTNSNQLQQDSDDKSEFFFELLSDIPMTSESDIETFCVFLGLGTSACETIVTRSNRGNYNAQKLGVVKQWGNKKPRTMKDFIIALDKTEYCAAVKELAKKHQLEDQLKKCTRSSN